MQKIPDWKLTCCHISACGAKFVHLLLEVWKIYAMCQLEPRYTYYLFCTGTMSETNDVSNVRDQLVVTTCPFIATSSLIHSAVAAKFPDFSRLYVCLSWGKFSVLAFFCFRCMCYLFFVFGCQYLLNRLRGTTPKWCVKWDVKPYRWLTTNTNINTRAGND